MRSADPNVLKNNRKSYTKSLGIIAAGAILGGAIGLGAFHISSPRWTASVAVQIGQIARPEGEGAALTSRMLENPLTVVDRFNLPATRLRILESLGLPAPESGESKESRLAFNTFRAAMGRGPDVINLQVSGFSPESAENALQASFKLLSAEHQKIFEPAIGRLKTDFSTAQDKLNGAERDYASSHARLQEGSQKSDSTAGTRDILLTNIAVLASAQITALRRLTTQLQESLDPARSYTTRMIGPVYVPERPSSPSRLVYVAAGLAIGMAGGILVVFMRMSRRERYTA